MQNYNILILGRAESDGSRWVLSSYQDYGTLAAVEARASINAREQDGVYSIEANDAAGTLVRKNY